MSEYKLPTLEFRIPISPNDKYMRMLQYFVESIQAFGGEIARAAHCVVVVGEDIEPFDLKKQYNWTIDYSIEFIWVDRETFKKDTYDATGYIRLDVQSDADVVALVDADLLFAGNFDDIILECYQKQCVLGFIAHVTPFRDSALAETSSEEWWNRIFTVAGLSLPEFKWKYTGWGLMDNHPKQIHCPAYYNYGVIIMPRVLVEKKAKSYVSEIAKVEKVIDTFFKSQIANTLVFARYNMPCEALSINYNFPLNVDADSLRAINPDPNGKNSPEDIKIFHYLASGEINKRHFATEQSLHELLTRQEMTASGKVFQNKLKIVHDRILANKKFKLAEILIDRIKASASVQERPKEIILCGGRRTGSTLLNAILCSDSRCNPLGAEPQIMTRLIEAYKWGKKKFDIMIEGSFFDNQSQYRLFFQEMMVRFTTEVSERMSPGGILVLKNPEFSLVLIEMLELFQNSIFIATVRDPRDQVASEIECEQRKLSDAGKDPNLLDRDIDKFAERYLNYMRQIMKIHTRHTGQINIIRYEDLIMDTEQTLIKLEEITGLELAFDPQKSWSRVSDKAGLDITASRSKLYGAPINKSSIGRFKNDLEADEIKMIEKICLKIMSKFGYQKLY